MSIDFDIDKSGECVGEVTSRQLANGFYMLASFLRAAAAQADATGEEGFGRLERQADMAQAMANRLDGMKALLLKDGQ